MDAVTNRNNCKKSPSHRRSPRALRLVAPLLLLLVLTACNSNTVLLVNFNADTVGSPPAAAQSTGSVALDVGAGSVTVVASPAAGMPNNKWARISHPTAPSTQTAMRADFAQFEGPGRYSLISVMYIPRGTGVATVAFEPFGQPADSYLNFLHIDFMPEGNVRIDDGPVVFGSFPHDQSFTLNVALDITNTSATAEISLLGGVASGNTTVTIDSSLMPVARQFGAVRYWMGFQHQGSFFVDDILVTRAKG